MGMRARASTGSGGVPKGGSWAKPVSREARPEGGGVPVLAKAAARLALAAMSWA